MTEVETQEMLDKIAQAVKEANGDPKKEAILLDAIIDPADANACEGCQQFDIILEVVSLRSEIDWLDVG